MEVKGMAVGFIDVPQEHTEAYNYWYDFDHLAENLALPEICGARRYVATPDCKAVRDCRFPPLDGGQGTYFTSYLINTDDLDAAGESWHRLGTDLRKKRRFFRYGNVPYGGIYRLKKTLLSPSVPPVVTEAGPWLGHQGVLVVLSQVRDPSMQDAVEEWFEQVHAPDVLEIPGMASGMRFWRYAPGKDEPDEGWALNLYLLDGDPVEVKKEINRRIPGWLEQGRMPSPGGASDAQFLSVYRSVVPTKYDFRVE